MHGANIDWIMLAFGTLTLIAGLFWMKRLGLWLVGVGVAFMLYGWSSLSGYRSLSGMGLAIFAVSIVAMARHNIESRRRHAGME